MSTLVLSHRYSSDSNALFAAALASGWDVERLHSFLCPEGLAAREPVFYGETLLADAIAAELGIVLLEPTADWLPLLPARYRLRDIRLMTLQEAVQLPERVFVKPTDEKWFPARVYELVSSRIRARRHDVPGREGAFYGHSGHETNWRVTAYWLLAVYGHGAWESDGARQSWRRGYFTRGSGYLRDCILVLSDAYSRPLYDYRHHSRRKSFVCKLRTHAYRPRSHRHGSCNRPA